MSLASVMPEDISSMISDFGTEVSLKAPDGETYSAEGILRFSGRRGRVIDVETGQEILIRATSLTLSYEALPRLPRDGERWDIDIPGEGHYRTKSGRPPGGSPSLGFVRLYLERLEDPEPSCPSC